MGVPTSKELHSPFNSFDQLTRHYYINIKDYNDLDPSKFIWGNLSSLDQMFNGVDQALIQETA